MSEFFEAGVCMTPANFGPLRDFNGNARITGPCGDTIEIWLSVSGEKIEDARFTTDGCFESSKCGSTVAFMARGMSLTRAKDLTPEQILTRAGDIPAESHHCAVLATNTLKAAIADYYRRNHAELRSGEKLEVFARSILSPKPKLIISCRGADGKDNALVVVYAGNCSFDPPSLMVGVVPSRYSHNLIKENPCFVANLVTPAQKELYDYMGSKSGRDGDKFAATNAKSVTGTKVNAPVLLDCPVNIECTVVDSIMTGSHEMFIGKIEYVHADKEFVLPDGTLDWNRIPLL